MVPRFFGHGHGSPGDIASTESPDALSAQPLLVSSSWQCLMLHGIQLSSLRPPCLDVSVVMLARGWASETHYCFFSLFFLSLFKVLLKYSWFTRLWWFLLYNKVTQSYIYIYPFSLRIFSHTDYHRILGREGLKTHFYSYDPSPFIFTPLCISFNISISQKRTVKLREATRAAQVPGKGTRWDLNPPFQVPSALTLLYTTQLLLGPLALIFRKSTPNSTNL